MNDINCNSLFFSLIDQRKRSKQRVLWRTHHEVITVEGNGCLQRIYMIYILRRICLYMQDTVTDREIL